VKPYWIEGGGLGLGILLRPRGRDWLCDDVAAAGRAGVQVFISALTEAENEELGLSDEARCCSEARIEFSSFPIEDRSLPVSLDAVDGFVEVPFAKLQEGKGIAIHCRAGIGRSALLCA
jgi:protein-tyrosine phosphatase